MAKQSGLHQIRGKVGEHSYYRQSGVHGGLIRSINQGLSQRVKMSPEYANVRLNNAEFGQAGRIASVLGEMITPKYRPMILPFSQSKMAKVILEAIKATNGDWGQRNISTTSGSSTLIDALNFVSKGNFDDFGLKLSNDGANFEVTSNEQFKERLNAIGAAGAMIRIINAGPWIGSFVMGSSIGSVHNNYAQSFAKCIAYESSISESYDSVSTGIEFPSEPVSGWPAFQLKFVIVIVLPYRVVNNTQYTLQEHCTYRAFEVPTVPEP